MASTSTPGPEAPLGESDGTVVPVIPARDVSQIVGFSDQPGFDTKAGPYPFVNRHGIDLQHTHAPGVDPFSAAGMTFGGAAGAQSTNDESAAARLWQSLSGVEDKP